MTSHRKREGEEGQELQQRRERKRGKARERVSWKEELFFYSSVIQKRKPPAPLFQLDPTQNSATIAWREEYKPDEITFDDIKALNTGRLELSKDRDVDGRPLVFFRLR